MNDEDINIIENFIGRDFSNPMGWSGYYDSELKELQQAIKNLLNRNKELEEIEQEHKKENGELREKVKELEEENTVLKKANNISEDVKIEDITKFINKSIEDFNKEYIPVAKIKERIKKYAKKFVETKEIEDELIFYILEGK